MQLLCYGAFHDATQMGRLARSCAPGVFMSSLDLFIVNIAFPAIAKHFGGASLGSLSWILSAYAIVFAALLVPAGRWADAFGRKRAFLLGLGVFVRASARVRARAVGRLADRRAGRPGGRRRADAADVARPDAAGVRRARAPRGDRRVGGDRRHRRRRRPAARRSARAGRLAAGVPRQHARRAARPRPSACACCAERREQDAGAARRARRSCADRRRSARSWSAIVKGQEWGWGSAAILALLAVAGGAAAGDLVALGAPRRADRRAGDAARAQLRLWPSAPRCCSSPASARCCSPACCSSRASGTRTC